MIGSVFEIVVGFSGFMGLILKIVGPLTVAPTVTLIGMSLYPVASNKTSEQWWIALL